MPSLEKKISPLIRSQFPEIYREDADTLITFIEAYYEWLEESDNTIDYSRSLLDYQDIDTSVDTFIDQYKQMYMDGFPLETVVDTKFIIKHIMDLYKSKGSPKSVDLLFRLVFGEGADVYKPSDDIFTLSDSKYFSPVYIEVTSVNLAKLIQLDGKDIVGSQTGAKAFVEGIATKITNNKVVHVIYLSNVRGNFATGEQVTDDGLLDGSPIIVGSLSSIIITNGGANNLVGDTFTIEADVGKQAKGRVASIEN